MQNRHSDGKLYFEELASTCRNYYLDYLNKFIKIDSKTRVLEIGCGQGGNLLPFAELGCYVAGMDLEQKKIDDGTECFNSLGYQNDLVCMDFMKYPYPEEEDKKFDIIMIHDVIEHIPSVVKYDCMQRMKMFLKQDGVIFFGFPAWQMPFGGHQQICKHFVSKIPFIHLLPKSLYVLLLKTVKEDQQCIDELLSIREAKMPIEKFEKLYKSAGMKLVNRTLWFINPHYKQKFNLTPRKQNRIIASVPYLRNFFTTSCFYLLKK